MTRDQVFPSMSVSLSPLGVLIKTRPQNNNASVFACVVWMWALAVLQLTAVAGSLTRMPLVSTACPRVAVTRSNNIVMR